MWTGRATDAAKMYATQEHQREQERRDLAFSSAEREAQEAFDSRGRVRQREYDQNIELLRQGLEQDQANLMRDFEQGGERRDLTLSQQVASLGHTRDQQLESLGLNETLADAMDEIVRMNTAGFRQLEDERTARGNRRQWVDTAFGNAARGQGARQHMMDRLAQDRDFNRRATAHTRGAQDAITDETIRAREARYGAAVSAAQEDYMFGAGQAQESYDLLSGQAQETFDATGQQLADTFATRGQHLGEDLWGSAVEDARFHATQWGTGIGGLEPGTRRLAYEQDTRQAAARHQDTLDSLDADLLWNAPQYFGAIDRGNSYFNNYFEQYSRL